MGKKISELTNRQQLSGNEDLPFQEGQDNGSFTISSTGSIGSKWEEFDDELLYKPYIRTKGTFAQKPLSSQGIQQGFSYFCTDKQTTEGSRNGIMIYYVGDDTWTDALGRYIH